MAERRITVGLASGIGNAVFMLPTIKVLKEQGNRITLFVQGDYPMADLFRRCVYADEVIESPQSAEGDLLCGYWRPKAWDGMNVRQVKIGFPYTMSETASNFRLTGISEMPDVSDWCKDLDRTPRWDVGIVPGCKSGAWIRKRYPAMKDIASFYLAQGRSVAVFGADGDGIEEIPGDRVSNASLAKLPDLLAGCRVIIGTDSGPTHLASSLGVPVVMVFTATSEIKGRPMGPHRIVKADLNCRPCQTIPRWWACRDWKCQRIEVSEIIQASENLCST